jgi:copper(I)-binding protein
LLIVCNTPRSADMKTFPAIALVLLLACSGAQAEVEAIDAWVRGLPPGTPNTSAYMTLRNTGNNAMELTGARSSSATSVTLHDTMDHDGMLHMMHVGSISIPAQGEVALASGAKHLMLEVAQQPAVGSEVELVLQFADGSELTVLVPVRSVLDE